jgi:tetratricopeptide (TPR) repeat protein
VSRPTRHPNRVAGLTGALLLATIGCASTAREIAPTPSKDASPLERQFAAAPNDPALNLQLGAAAEAGGDLLRAEQYYLRAEALGTPPAEIVPRLLRVLVAARRYDEALERCRRRLSRAPEDRPTRLVEAALLVALERPKEAEHELNTLVRTKPADPQPYLALGKLYRDGYHDAARARAMFEKFLALAPAGEQAEVVRYELADEPPPAAPEGEAAP